MGTGKRCVKTLLFSFNVVFLLSGLAAAGCGIWMLFDPGRFDQFFGTYKIMYAASILIASGLFAILVAFCGCWGAIKENKCLLGTYFAMLLLIFCAQVAAGVLGFLFKGQIKFEVKKHSAEIIKRKYGTGNRDLDHAVDLVQEKFDCCGATQYRDYRNSEWAKGQSNKKSVPESCCSDPKQCATATKDSLINKRGCDSPLINYSMRYLSILGGIGIGLGVIQLFGMCFSCCLFFAIER